MLWRRHVRDSLGHTSRLDRTRTRRRLSRTWGDVAKLIKWNIRSVVYDTVVVAHIWFFYLGQALGRLNDRSV